jgi:hypothetical protein
MGGKLYRPLAEFLLHPESPLTYAAHVFAADGERETTREELLLAAARAVVLCEQLDTEDTRPTLAIDRRGWRVTYANEAARRALPGRPEVVGLCLWDVSVGYVGTEAGQRMREQLSLVRAAGDHHEFTAYSEGAKGWVQVSATGTGEGVLIVFEPLPTAVLDHEPDRVYAADGDRGEADAASASG